MVPDHLVTCGQSDIYQVSGRETLLKYFFCVRPKISGSRIYNLLLEPQVVSLNLLEVHYWEHRRARWGSFKESFGGLFGSLFGSLLRNLLGNLCTYCRNQFGIHWGIHLRTVGRSVGVYFSEFVRHFWLILGKWNLRKGRNKVNFILLFSPFLSSCRKEEKLGNQLMMTFSTYLSFTYPWCHSYPCVSACTFQQLF